MSSVQFNPSLLSSDFVIVVTGATGWIGRSALHELQSIIPAASFNQKVLSFASRHARLISTGYGTASQIVVPVYPLTDLPEMVWGKTIFVLHSAFLTPSSAKRFSPDEYVVLNRQITKLVHRALGNAKRARVVCLSSGVAATVDANSAAMLPTNCSRHDYACLKREEELCLATVVPTQIFRIYALSGRFFGSQAPYALVEFVAAALQMNRIKIEAGYDIVRGYSNASEVASLAIHWLLSQSSPSRPLDAVSAVTTLVDLAADVSKLFGIQEPESAIDASIPPDVYASDTFEYLARLKAAGISPLSLQGQILDTAGGIAI